MPTVPHRPPPVPVADLRRRAAVAGLLLAALGATSLVACSVDGRDDAARAASAAEAAPTDAEPALLTSEERAAEELATQAEEEAAEADRQAEQAAAAAAEDAERREREEREAAEHREREAAEAAERHAREEAEAAEAAERAAAEALANLLHAQERLRELGYLVGPADGKQGQQTTAALMAFQSVNALSVDGVLGPQTLGALDAPRAEPVLRGGPSTRIEVDMNRQVLHLVEGGTRVTTMKVSTGRGGTFETEDGQTLRAVTPVGTFTIGRRIAGERPSSYGIGSMWDPMYFHGPWAIHGSPNVPAGPASAGCVRISMADGRWLFDRVPNGTAVVLYGGTHVFTP